MKNMNPDAGASAAQTRIEALVGAYPTLNDQEQQELLQWYRRVATSYDMAMLSARDDIKTGYDHFKKDHVDRISPATFVFVVLMMLAVSGLLYAYAPALT